MKMMSDIHVEQHDSFVENGVNGMKMDMCERFLGIVDKVVGSKAVVIANQRSKEPLVVDSKVRGHDFDFCPGDIVKCKTTASDIRIKPYKMQSLIPFSVVAIHSNGVELNNGAIMPNDFLKKHSANELTLGQPFFADFISHCKGGYNWRCVKIHPITAIRVSRNQTFLVSDAPDKFVFTFEVENLTDRCISGISKWKLCQTKIAGPSTAVRLQPFQKKTVTFQAEILSYGDISLTFEFVFNNVTIQRKVNIRSERRDLEPNADGVNNNRGEKKAQAKNAASVQESTGDRRNQRDRRPFLASYLPQYEIPEYIVNQFRKRPGGFRAFCKQLDDAFPYLCDALDYENYVKRFRTLVYLEEMKLHSNYVQNHKNGVTFSRENAGSSKEYLSLPLNIPQDALHLLSVGDIVMATPTSKSSAELSTTEPLEGTTQQRMQSSFGKVHKVRKDSVLLRFDEAFQKAYKGEKYEVSFSFSRVNFRKKHYVIEKAIQRLPKEFLFPDEYQEREPLMDVSEHSKTRNLKLFDDKLNDVQKDVVVQILNGGGHVRQLPYIIFGPPGTGKTRTIIEAVLQLVTNTADANVLVATATNSAADNFTKKLIANGALKNRDILRLISHNSDETDAELLPYSSTLSLEADFRNAHLVGQRNKVYSHRIIVSTLGMMGNLMTMGSDPDHFTHVFLDEASMCSEPDAMMAISQVSTPRGQVVIAGDPKQLPPFVYDQYAGARGLSVSFLKRIMQRKPYAVDLERFRKTMGYNPLLITKLLHNYRSLESIIKVSNSLYYDSQLVANISNHDSAEIKLLQRIKEMNEGDKSPATHAVYFYSIFAKDQQGIGSSSWYNSAEAYNVYVHTTRLYERGFKPEQIGIVTPYTCQVQAIENQFQTNSHAMPKIGSVEEFQGQERDIIFISTVRSTNSQLSLSQPPSFVLDPRRFNVAVTRAKVCLFIYGNPRVLTISDDWLEMIWHCRDNDAYKELLFKED